MTLIPYYLDPSVIDNYIVTLATSPPAVNDNTQLEFTDKFTGTRYFPFIPNLINIGNDYDTSFCLKKTEAGPIYYVTAWRSAIQSAAYETKKWKLRFKLKVIGRCEAIDIIGRIYQASQAVPTPEQLSLVTGAEFTTKIPIDPTTQSSQENYNTYNCEVTITGFDPTGKYLFLILNAKVTNKDNDEKLLIFLEQGQTIFIDGFGAPIGNTSSALIYDTGPIEIENTLTLMDAESPTSFYPKVDNSHSPPIIDSVVSVITASAKSENTINSTESITNVDFSLLEITNSMTISDNIVPVQFENIISQNTQLQYYTFSSTHLVRIFSQNTQIHSDIYSPISQTNILSINILPDYITVTSIGFSAINLEHTPTDYIIFSSDIAAVTTTYANGEWEVTKTNLDTGDWDRS